MTNLETIQFLYSNYNKFLNRRGVLREVIEDCLSTITSRLLKVDKDIDNPENYITRALSLEIRDYNRLNYKYKQDTFNLTAEALESPCIIEQINEYQEEHINLTHMYESITNLPKAQQQAVQDYLVHGKTGMGEGNKNTQRTNFKLALATLRANID